MRQDNTHKILQRIENQQLPDLSQMDKHWEEMQQLLAGGVVSKPVVSLTAKWLVAATAFILIGLFAWKKGWFASGNNNKDAKQEFVAKPQQQQQQPQQPDTTSNFQPVSPYITIPPANSYSQNYTGLSTKDNSTGINNLKKDIPVPANNNVVSPAQTEKQIEAMNAQLMQQFWNQIEKKPQQFVIDNRRDSELEGAEGTTVKIPANAFANTNDKITIELTEFYDYSDMIANKLTTTSYQRQLVSDGMLRIKAIQNGVEIKMTGLKPMNIYMPRRDKNSNMQLFAGEWKEFIGGTKLVNWIPMGQQQNYFFGDGSRNTGWEPYVIRKRLFSKKLSLKYALNDWDTVTVQQAKQIIQQSYPNDIVKVRRGRPNRIRLFKNHMTRFTITRGPVWNSRRDFFEYGYAPRNPKELSTRDSLERRYEFSISATGWINCDRFLHDPSPKVEFAVTGNAEEKVYCAYLVFKDIKSVMPSYFMNNKCTFRDVPVGKEVTLITIGISNGKTICSIRNMKTGSGDIGGLQFLATSPQEFKRKMASMNL